MASSQSKISTADLRVLHILPPEPFGGAQVIALQLAIQQQNNGMHASILLTREGKQMRLRAKRDGIDIAAPGVGASQVARAVFVASEIVRSDATVFHLHMPPPWTVVLLPIMAKQSVVIHLHTGPSVGGRWFDRIACTRIVRKATRLIAVSEWVGHEWREAIPGRLPPIDVVLNGVSLPANVVDPVVPKPDGAPVFGVAARLEADKGLQMFLQMAASIAHLLPAAEFRVAGIGSAEASLRQLAADFGIANRIRFIGFVEDIGTFWSGVDVAIFSAKIEPFGLRLLEPIMNGVPVVAFRTGAGSDEVIARCRGIASAEWGDLKTATAMATRLARDKTLRREMVVKGFRDIVEWFTIERMETGVRATYEKAIRRSDG
jgi:glycosyltransferase involved in cell wall biosynthesis